MAGIGTAALMVFIIIICIIAIYQWWRELTEMQKAIVIGAIIVCAIILIFGP